VRVVHVAKQVDQRVLAQMMRQGMHGQLVKQ
jgi:hypothetical protein